jgi:hypothetical protein
MVGASGGVPCPSLIPSVLNPIRGDIMQIRITDGGKFAHPNPKFYTRPHLVVKTDDVIEVDDEQGNLIIGLGRAVQIVDERLIEVRKAEEVEVPPAAQYVEEDPPKRKRGRPPGKRRKE